MADMLDPLDGQSAELPDGSRVVPGDEWVFYLERFQTKVHCNTDIPDRFARLQDYFNATATTDNRPMFEHLPIRHATWSREMDGAFRPVERVSACG